MSHAPILSRGRGTVVSESETGMVTLGSWEKSDGQGTSGQNSSLNTWLPPTV